MSRRSGSARSVVPEQWRLLYSLNPMVGVIDGFRWCILGGQSDAVSSRVSRLSLVVGGVFPVVRHPPFRKTEKSFADLI